MPVSVVDIHSTRTELYDYQEGSDIIFIGIAHPGSKESAAVWQIQQMAYDANSNVISRKWADGSSEFKFIWNNRIKFTYA